MNEWRRVHLDEVVTLQRGYDLPQNARTPGSIPVVGSAGISGSHCEAREQGPGVVIGRSGASIGHATYVQGPYWPLNTGLFVRDFKNNDPRWVFLALDSIDFSGFDSGSAQPSLNRNFLAKIPVSVPPRAVQRAIADVLSALDDKIAANNKLATTAEALLRLEFRRLGIDREPAPEKAIVVADLFHLNPARPKPSDENPVYVDMARLPTAGFAVSRWTRRPQSGGVRFRNGDTVMARITPCLENGKVGYVDFLDSDQVGIGSTEYIVMRSREDLGIPLQLSYFLARSPRFHSNAIQQMVGTSGRQRVAAKDLEEFRLTAPHTEGLARFGALAGPLFRRVRAATDESNRLAATRDAILPALMSGRLAVRDARATVESAVDEGAAECEAAATSTLW